MATPLIEMTGLVFGKLTVVERGVSGGRVKWRCSCTCGGDAYATGFELRSGRRHSCGCAASETLVKRNTTHGFSRLHPVEYRIWKNMRGRCLSKADSDYPAYGGRGILICEAWSSFPAFFADMGARPDGHSLDRIDVNGPYSPQNCRWANSKTQARNKRSNHVIEYRGAAKTLQEWSEEYGLEPSLVRYRLKQGWNLDDVFSTEDRRTKRRIAP